MILPVPVLAAVITALPPVPEIVASGEAGEILQVPVAGDEVNVVVKPWHTLNDPAIMPGNGFTVTGRIAEHPSAV